MVKYTIDSSRREYVYYSSALVAIVLTPLINYGIDSISKASPPLNFISNFHLTGFILFGLMLFIFSNLLWKCSFLSGIPNLNGKWTGNYVRYNDEKHDISAQEATGRFEATPDVNKIEIIVEQNWLKMSIVYKSAHSVSTSTAIDFKVENKQVYEINYLFDSRERTGLTPANKYGSGVSSITITHEDGSDRLEGTYYTQKGNRGFFVVKKSNT